MDILVCQWSEKRIESYKNGKIEGLSKGWHKDGNKKFETYYKGGKLDGLSIWWYENGQKQAEIDYIDGLRNGDAKWWDEKEGYLTCTEKVQNDLKEGPTNWFYKSGAKKEVSHFKAGKYNGISTWWHETGEVSAKEIMKIIYGLEPGHGGMSMVRKKELSPIKMVKSKDSHRVGTKTERNALK